MERKGIGDNMELLPLAFALGVAAMATDEKNKKGKEMNVQELIDAINQQWEKRLDKIRAEIESIEHYGTNNGHDLWLRTPDEIKKDVLIILDKYKAESEGK